MWAEFCNDCGNYPVTVYFDKKTHRLTSICSRCQGKDTKVIIFVEQRREIENAYFEKLIYNRELDDYLYGLKTSTGLRNEEYSCNI